MAERTGVRWQPAKYASLSKEVQKAYDEYVAADTSTKEKANALKAAAERAWKAANPDGVGGKFVRFHAINGTLMWMMSDSVSAKEGYRSKGVDIPSAHP